VAVQSVEIGTKLKSVYTANEEKIAQIADVLKKDPGSALPEGDGSTKTFKVAADKGVTKQLKRERF
jgi:hypothetical protein